MAVRSDNDAQRERIERAIETVGALIREHHLGAASAKPAALKAAFRELMDALSLNQAELAQHLEVDAMTVSRWVRGGTVPRPSVIRRIQALTSRISVSRGRAAIVRSTVPAFLRADDIAKHISDASDFWILKWGRRFVSGSDSALNQALSFSIKAIKSADDREQARSAFPRYHYLFPSPGLVLPNSDAIGDALGMSTAAHDSFLALKSDLEEQHDGDLADVVHGHAIEDLSDLLRLGLTPNPIGYFMIDYQRDARKKLGRRADIFIEVDAPDLMSDPFEGSGGDPFGTYWVRLAPHVGEELRARWWPVLDRLCERDRERAAADAAAPGRRDRVNA